ncbi:LytTR family DNA-binding domain-containing protein [Paenibacillus sp. J5C_2022]|uniref:LytR/AlgR family response regulator transcription factor n=1 Tax=Paenibacillus sp. J5C2022 TaxID=2977129 RepID=UPI0021D2F046|nr:LytTR family DNA-binding domain-containing protein [Paenibacillus sp. J5C2022]MCU6712609.1 LytTR family DNA-binding domain-containing protein [Paenibacillus sp. J5C2022]
MDQKIRVLIVDDEPHSRAELKHLLGEQQGIQIAGEADNGEAALMKAIQLQPDVMFLDIEMPGMNGLEAAKSLRELKKPPLLVFATAYPDFAVQAFRYEATDYLLKPYDEEQLADTMERVRKTLVRDSGGEKREAPRRTAGLGKLAIESGGEIMYLEPGDIRYIVFEDKGAKIVCVGREYMTKLTLKELERRLSAYSFHRVHKSYLVNLDSIKRLTPWFNGAYQLELDGMKELVCVSRNYVKGLRERLEI